MSRTGQNSGMITKAVFMLVAMVFLLLLANGIYYYMTGVTMFDFFGQLETPGYLPTKEFVFANQSVGALTCAINSVDAGKTLPCMLKVNKDAQHMPNLDGIDSGATLKCTGSGEHMKCHVTGFWLPQKITTAGEVAHLGFIWGVVPYPHVDPMAIGKYVIQSVGDPNFLVYPQVFPPGEDRQWRSFTKWYNDVGILMFSAVCAFHSVTVITKTLRAVRHPVQSIKSIAQIARNFGGAIKAVPSSLAAKIAAKGGMSLERSALSRAMSNLAADAKILNNAKQVSKFTNAFESGSKYVKGVRGGRGVTTAEGYELAEALGASRYAASGKKAKNIVLELDLNDITHMKNKEKFREFADFWGGLSSKDADVLYGKIHSNYGTGVKAEFKIPAKKMKWADDAETFVDSLKIDLPNMPENVAFDAAERFGTIKGRVSGKPLIDHLPQSLQDDILKGILKKEIWDATKQAARRLGMTAGAALVLRTISQQGKMIDTYPGAIVLHHTMDSDNLRTPHQLGDMDIPGVGTKHVTSYFVIEYEENDGEENVCFAMVDGKWGWVGDMPDLMPIDTHIGTIYNWPGVKCGTASKLSPVFSLDDNPYAYGRSMDDFGEQYYISQYGETEDAPDSIVYNNKAYLGGKDVSDDYISGIVERLKLINNEPSYDDDFRLSFGLEEIGYVMKNIDTDDYVTIHYTIDDEETSVRYPRDMLNEIALKDFAEGLRNTADYDPEEPQIEIDKAVVLRKSNWYEKVVNSAVKPMVLVSPCRANLVVGNDVVGCGTYVYDAITNLTHCSQPDKTWWSSVLGEYSPKCGSLAMKDFDRELVLNDVINSRANKEDFIARELRVLKGINDHTLSQGDMEITLPDGTKLDRFAVYDSMNEVLLYFNQNDKDAMFWAKGNIYTRHTNRERDKKQTYSWLYFDYFQYAPGGIPKGDVMSIDSYAWEVCEQYGKKILPKKSSNSLEVGKYNENRTMRMTNGILEDAWICEIVWEEPPLFLDYGDDNKLVQRIMFGIDETTTGKCCDCTIEYDMPVASTDGVEFYEKYTTSRMKIKGKSGGSVVSRGEFDAFYYIDITGTSLLGDYTSKAWDMMVFEKYSPGRIMGYEWMTMKELQDMGYFKEDSSLGAESEGQPLSVHAVYDYGKEWWEFDSSEKALQELGADLDDMKKSSDICENYIKKPRYPWYGEGKLMTGLLAENSNGEKKWIYFNHYLTDELERIDSLLMGSLEPSLSRILRVSSTMNDAGFREGFYWERSRGRTLANWQWKTPNSLELTSGGWMERVYTYIEDGGSGSNLATHGVKGKTLDEAVSGCSEKLASLQNSVTSKDGSGRRVFDMFRGTAMTITKMVASDQGEFYGIDVTGDGKWDIPAFEDAAPAGWLSMSDLQAAGCFGSSPEVGSSESRPFIVNVFYDASRISSATLSFTEPLSLSDAGKGWTIYDATSGIIQGSGMTRAGMEAMKSTRVVSEGATPLAPDERATGVLTPLNWAVPVRVADSSVCEDCEIELPLSSSLVGITSLLGSREGKGIISGNFFNEGEYAIAMSPWKMVRDEMPMISLFDSNRDGKIDMVSHELLDYGVMNTWANFETHFADNDLDGELDSVTSNFCKVDAITVQVEMEPYETWCKGQDKQTNYCYSSEYSGFWDVASVAGSIVASGVGKVVGTFIPGVGWVLSIAVDCGIAYMAAETKQSWPGS